jgi:nitroreductase
MDVFQAIKTMLAVRDYEDKPVPDEVVKRILEAGRLTGSSRNTQQWDFIVVRDRQKLEKLGELAVTGRYIANAALAIAVVVPDAAVGYVDGSRATQDMMLAAWGEGIGSNWVGNANTQAIKQLLGVPVERMVLNIIPFGYPTREIGQGIKDRKPLSEIAHVEKFGKPFEE